MDKCHVEECSKMKSLKLWNNVLLFYLKFEKYIFPWHLPNSLIFASHHFTNMKIGFSKRLFRICNLQRGLFYLCTFLRCFIMTWNKVQLQSNSNNNAHIVSYKKSYGSLIVILYYVLIICTSVTFLLMKCNIKCVWWWCLHDKLQCDPHATNSS